MNRAELEARVCVPLRVAAADRSSWTEGLSIGDFEDFGLVRRGCNETDHCEEKDEAKNVTNSSLVDFQPGDTSNSVRTGVTATNCYEQLGLPQPQNTDEVDAGPVTPSAELAAGVRFRSQAK